MTGSFRSRLLLGTLCGCYIASLGGSLAEAKSNPAPSAAPEEAAENNDSWYGKSVFERPRADYTLDAKHVGSFKVKPSMQIYETSDDNIYAASAGEVSDFITKVTPSIGIESDWGRHAVNFNASGDLGFYSDHSDENYGDYSVGTSARLDLVRETFMLASASSSHLHEDRGSPDSVSNSNGPTEYNQNNANISLMRGLRRVSLKLGGDYTGYKYQNGETNTGTVIVNNGRDRDVYKVTGRIGYEIIPEYEAFFRTTINERDYDAALDGTGVNRDSSGYDAVVGTALDLGGKTKGEIFAGYMSQNYDSSTLKNIDGVQFGGNILWNATNLTSIKTGVLRAVQETSSANSSGYISTQYSIGLQHEFLYNVLGGVNVSFETDEYVGTGLVRSDDIAGVGAEIKYLMNKNISVIGKCNYSTRDSNLANQDYDRGIVSIGLKIEL